MPDEVAVQVQVDNETAAMATVQNRSLVSQGSEVPAAATGVEAVEGQVEAAHRPPECACAKVAADVAAEQLAAQPQEPEPKGRGEKPYDILRIRFGTKGCRPAR